MNCKYKLKFLGAAPMMLFRASISLYPSESLLVRPLQNKLGFWHSTARTWQTSGKSICSRNAPLSQEVRASGQFTVCSICIELRPRTVMLGLLLGLTSNWTFPLFRMLEFQRDTPEVPHAECLGTRTPKQSLTVPGCPRPRGFSSRVFLGTSWETVPVHSCSVCK